MTTSRRGELAYLAGRAASLGSRPAYLLICNHFFGNAAAAVVASLILVAAMLAAIASVDSHRIYYARRFGDAPGSVARAYSRYIFAQLLMGLAAAAAGGAYFLLIEGSAWLMVGAVLFIVSERLADEVLRYTLFERSRPAWGWFMLARVGFQMALVGLIVLVRPAVEPGTFFAFALLTGNLLAFGRRIPFDFLRRTAVHPWLIARHLRQAVRLIVGCGLIWLLSLAAMLGSYLDRLIVLVARKGDLAAFSLVVVSLSIVQNAVEYFYFSQKRRDFLQGTIRFADVVRSRLFLAVVVSSLVVGVGLTFASIWLYRDAPPIPLIVIVLVAVEQVTIATATLVREIAYWNNQLRAILRVEIVFFVSLAGIFGTLAAFEPSYVWLLAAGAAAMMLRLFLLARIRHERLPLQ